MKRQKLYLMDVFFSLTRLIEAKTPKNDPIVNQEIMSAGGRLYSESGGQVCVNLHNPNNNHISKDASGQVITSCEDGNVSILYFQSGLDAPDEHLCKGDKCARYQISSLLNEQASEQGYWIIWNMFYSQIRKLAEYSQNRS